MGFFAVNLQIQLSGFIFQPSSERGITVELYFPNLPRPSGDTESKMVVRKLSLFSTWYPQVTWFNIAIGSTLYVHIGDGVALKVSSADCCVKNKRQGRYIREGALFFYVFPRGGIILEKEFYQGIYGM